MVCPVCNTEARIKSLPQAIKRGDKYFDRMIFECRNKNCTMYQKEVGHNDIEFTVIEENDEEET